jgi:hypothetical protein
MRALGVDRICPIYSYESETIVGPFGERQGTVEFGSQDTQTYPLYQIFKAAQKAPQPFIEWNEK